MNKTVIAYSIGILLLLIGGVFFLSRKSDPQPLPSADVLTIQETDWVKGDANSTLTLVEYADFQCPACKAYFPLVKQIETDYKGDLKIVMRNYPLPQHQNGEAASRVAEAAGLQGKYWEMHDRLYETQEEWSNLDNPQEKFLEYAKSLQLNVDQLTQDIQSSKVQDKINNDVASGNLLKVNSTPTFFLGGEKIPNPQSVEAFKTLIDAALLKARPVGENVHEHADFKVYLNGQTFDFARDKYQSTDNNPLLPGMHMHDGVGNLIHKHKTGITLGMFFESLGMQFTKDCFAVMTTEKYCNSASQSLKFYVNGQANDQFGNYEFKDLDRVLISYGPTNQDIQSQLNSLTDMACIYSEKCPERGTPPTENCVGGLGSDC